MLKNKDNKKITPIIIVGTGHHFHRNLIPAISKLKKDGEIRILATVDILNRGESGVSKGADHIKRNEKPIHLQLAKFKKENPLVILGHTNSLHAKDAYDLLSNGFCIAVEKPYALDSKSLNKYIGVANKNQCMLLEYYVTMKSVPLLLGYGELDLKSFYIKNWLIKPLPALKDYAQSVEDFSGKLTNIIGQINKVEVEVLEGEGETGTLEGRGIDTIDVKFGGGMIQDMATHALAPLLSLKKVIGSFPKVNDFYVRAAYNKEYMSMVKRRFALPIHRTGETYAELGFKTSKKIDVFIRFGKYVFGDRNSRGILISGSKGEVYLDMNDCTLYLNGRPILAIDKSYYSVIRAAIAEKLNEPLFNFDLTKVLADAQNMIFEIKKKVSKNKEKVYYKNKEKPEQIFKNKNTHDISEKDIRPIDSHNRWLQLLNIDIHCFFPVKNRKEVCCPGCLSKEYGSEFVKVGFIYKWCKNCLSLYASPRPSEKEIDEFYRYSKSMEFYGTRVFKLAIESRYQYQISPLSAWVEKIMEKCNSKTEKILDFMPKFYSVWGEVLKNTKKEISLVDPVHLIKNPDFSTKMNFSQAQKKKYDLITAFDVLDHRSDVRQTVKDLSKVCKKGGVLFLTLNSGSGFEYQILGRDAHRLVPPTKINLLTTEAIKHILMENGFEIIDLSTSGKLDVDIVAQTLYEDESTPINRFISYIIKKREPQTLEALQQFLSSNNLSSFLRIAARRK